MARRGRRRAVAGWAAAVVMALPATWAAAQEPGPPSPRPPAAAGQLATPAAKPKPPAAAPVADPAFEAARSVYEGLPEAERKAIQDALVWTGDYNSVVNGGFGRRTFEALAAYKARTRQPGDLLDPRARAAILAAGESARKAAKFSVRPDPASGVIVGVPEALLPKRTPIPGGTRWQSADGRVTLESRSSKPGESGLDALFERATAPAAGRMVTYKLKKPDFIVVTGETATGKFYVRHAAGREGVRGFTLAYDKPLSGEVDRLVIAVANSFVPFPEAGPPTPDIIVAKLKPPAGFAPGAPAGTGLAVAPGRVLTVASVLEGCAAPEVRGAPARLVKSDPASGLALLDAGGVAAGAALAVSQQAIASGDMLVTVAADASGLSVAPGSGSASGGLFAPLQPGASGAPVLDRSGALGGLVSRFPAAPRLVAGVMPPTSHAVVGGSAVAGFLAANGVATGAPAHAGDASLGTIASRVSGAVVPITCRK
ncbi:serine protease [Methylobacterium sp. sgz302541]|uniref:serine protease n=2 Tax=unclassified Methylobacterium TaxID=2615210 RepID=UPI003D3351D2